MQRLTSVAEAHVRQVELHATQEPLIKKRPGKHVRHFLLSFRSQVKQSLGHLKHLSFRMENPSTHCWHCSGLELLQVRQVVSQLASTSLPSFLTNVLPSD